MTSKKSFKKKMKNNKKISKKARKITNGAASVLLGAGMMTGAVKPVKIAGSRDDEITEVVSASVLGTEKSEVRTGTEQKTIDTETQNNEDSAVVQEDGVTEPVEVETEPKAENLTSTKETDTGSAENSTIISDKVGNDENTSINNENSSDETTKLENSEITSERESDGNQVTDEKEPNKSEITDEEDKDTNKEETEKKKVPIVNLDDIDVEKVMKGDEEELKKLDELKAYIEEIAEKHPLGIAGIFHIFGQEVEQNAHIAGNIAAEILIGTNFGTDADFSSNLTVGDVDYISSFGKTDNEKPLNKIDGVNKIVIFGPDIQYKSYEGGSAIWVTTEDKPNGFKVDIPYDHIIQIDKKLDIQGVLDKLSERSDEWAKHESTEEEKNEVTVQYNSESSKGSIVISSDAVKRAIDNNTPIYVNVPVGMISGQKYDINIDGIPAGADAPMIILNVTDIQGKELIVQTHLTLNYTDGSTVVQATNAHSQFNKLLWNFGTNLDTLTLDNDYFLGSVLAPKTHIIAEKNVDGNIIGVKVTIKGETHRWDLVPPMDIEIPDKPTPPDTPDPEDPKDPDPETPEDPTPTPPDTPDPEPTPEPEEPDPLPEEEPGSEYPHQPEFDEEEAVPPHAEAVEEDDEEEAVAPHAEKVEDEVAPVKSTTVPDETSKPISNQSAEVVEKQNEATLPETGDKNNEVAGALGALAAAMGITGLAVSRRRKATVKRDRKDKKHGK